jgi:heme-degrading monooxygenase HmoA
VIRTQLRMRVREGRTEEFERVWLAAAAVAARYPGAGRQTMLRDPDDPLDYTITADWAGPADLTRYQRSADREALSAVLERLRASAVKGLLEVVAHVDAAPDPAAAPVTAPVTATVPASAPGTATAPTATIPAPAEEGTVRP